uniref:GG12235 n=1 Tax=Drosophila erecta TaxID=7220 RepID=B3P6H7_DROER
MALRLTTIALLKRTPLLLVPKLKAAPPTRTIVVRKNLVPFLDDDPCVFSKKAVMHHWGVSVNRIVYNSKPKDLPHLP